VVLQSLNYSFISFVLHSAVPIKGMTQITIAFLTIQKTKKGNINVFQTCNSLNYSHFTCSNSFQSNPLHYIPFMSISQSSNSIHKCKLSALNANLITSVLANSNVFKSSLKKKKKQLNINHTATTLLTLLFFK